MHLYEDIENSLLTVIRGITDLPFNDYQVVVGGRDAAATKRVLTDGGVVIAYESSTTQTVAGNGVWLSRRLTFEVLLGVKYGIGQKTSIYDVMDAIIEAVERSDMGGVRLAYDSDGIHSDDGTIVWRSIAFAGVVARD